MFPWAGGWALRPHRSRRPLRYLRRTLRRMGWNRLIRHRPIYEWSAYRKLRTGRRRSVWICTCPRTSRRRRKCLWRSSLREIGRREMQVPNKKWRPEPGLTREQGSGKWARDPTSDIQKNRNNVEFIIMIALMFSIVWFQRDYNTSC